MADQLLSTVSHHSSLPDTYVRPESQRPRLHEVVRDANIPTIDLGSPDVSRVIAQVGDACRSFGFFQVVNHGVPVELMLAMMAVASEFFRLPPEEKAKHYSDDPAKKMRLSTSFNIRKETVLGEQEQHMAVNYYPKCPEPELTYGLQAHTDPNAVTILLQDPKVAGLQVLKDGKWIAVNPQPDAYVINIGDQLQALSNGRYRSVCHRAVVNSDKDRMSVASFLCPCNSAVISTPEKLVGDGSPAIYRSYTYGEYYNKFWSRNLDDEHCLELFKSQ
ncbi:hypothetical protein C4D60_Mb02t11540 [Musa balbisiana]|uniref:Fe2OG dioxygenase domain-containing protein n=1 Tax=Musa balbisiana TaxID=52838 RepID=A0A4S8IBB3_MUSBA|nr:hypothetical protein C4D60_Mb02t11540 [Musa balbisiana]